MPEKEAKEWRREELRGLFTLGLMAILITLRIGQRELVFTIMGQSYIFTQFVDITLACWGVYAFMMIVSFSTDIFDQRMCKISRAIGLSFLAITFIFYYAMVLVIAFMLPSYWNVLGYLLFIPIAYFAFKAFTGAIRFLIKIVTKEKSQSKKCSFNGKCVARYNKNQYS